MGKPRMVVVVSGGAVQQVLVSPQLIEKIQVVLIDYDVSDMDDHPSIAEDEEGQRAGWHLWDGPDMDLLEDELYEHINRLCL